MREEVGALSISIFMGSEFAAHYRDAVCVCDLGAVR